MPETTRQQMFCGQIRGRHLIRNHPRKIHPWQSDPGYIDNWQPQRLQLPRQLYKPNPSYHTISFPRRGQPAALLHTAWFHE